MNAFNITSVAKSDTLTASSKTKRGEHLKKGTLTIARNGLFTSHNYNYPNSNGFLTPQGYLIADRLFVGFQLSEVHSGQIGRAHV